MDKNSESHSFVGTMFPAIYFRPLVYFRKLELGGTCRGNPYSHSIVPGGLLVTSYTTRFTPFTSLMIRVAVSPRNFMSNW
jgi:hypothetical protein